MNSYPVLQIRKQLQTGLREVEEVCSGSPSPLQECQAGLKHASESTFISTACPPVPAPESLTKGPDMKIPGKERLFLAEGIKENFLEGLGFWWAPKVSQFLGKGEVV